MHACEAAGGKESVKRRGLSACCVVLQAIAKLVGDRALPWEALQPADRDRLGAFRGPVLELLRRDPSRRPTMAAFYHNCRLLIDASGRGPRAPPQ